MTTIIIIFNWLCLAAANLGSSQEKLLRFLVYLPPVIIYLGALGNLGRLDRRLFFVPLLYFGVVLLTVLAGATIDFYFVRDTLIISTAIMTFLVVYKFNDFHIKLLSVLFVFNVLINAWSRGNSFNPAFNLITSEGGLESSYGLSLGIFAIYFFVRRDWVWTCIALFAVILSFKRISFGGIIAVFGVDYGLRLLTISKSLFRLKRLVSLLALFSVMVGLFVGLNSKAIVSTLFSYIDPVTSIDTYLLGRYSFISIISADLQNISFVNLIFGHGPGSAERIIQRTLGLSEPPHNDHLKLFYEYGVVGALSIYFAIFKLFGRNILGLYLFIYQMILFLTDNTFIYYFHWFACWVAINAYDNVSLTPKIRTRQPAEANEWSRPQTNRFARCKDHPPNDPLGDQRSKARKSK